MSGVSPLDDQLARLTHPEAPQRGRSGAVGDLGLRTQEEVTAVLASIEAGDLCVDRVDSRHHNTAAAREIMMGGGNGVASVIMLTFTSEPCPQADFSK